MSQLNKLYRNFIILQEDERGYSNSNDKTLSGYSKIEAKGNLCKISFYAQNLRRDEEEYCILAICNKKDMKKILNLGKISVSDGGKAEVTKEYPLDNVAGLGISYDKISGAAIGKEKNGIPIIVMCGFINGEQSGDGWKNYKMVDCSHNKAKDKMEYIKKEEKKKKSKHRGEEESKSTDILEEEKIVEEREVEQEEVVQVEKEIEFKEEVQVESEETVIREEIEIDETETRDSKETNEEEEDADNPFIYENHNENPFNGSVEGNLYGIEDLNRGYLKNKFDEYEEKLEEKNSEFKIRGSVGEYFEGIASGFEVCRNKYNEIKFCKWYKVSVNDLHEMCNMSNYNRYAVAYYPMLNYYPYIRNHRYFMLGYKCDEERNLRYIVYGIPGEKNKDEQPYEGKTGFVTWVSNEDRDGMGCWLMFYDFKNSTVVVPMK